MPIVWILFFYALAFRATFLLQALPVPMVNDPKGIGYNDTTYTFLLNLILFKFDEQYLLVSCIAWALIHMRVKKKFDAKLVKFLLTIFSVGFALCLFTVFGNPFRLFEWYLD